MATSRQLSPLTQQPGQARVIERLRAICLAQPDATETVTFGWPAWQIRRKTFCVWEVYQDTPSICVNAGKAAQGLFLSDAKFYVTPYVGRHGWISRVATGRLPWSQIEGLVKQSYALAASRQR